MPSSTEQQRKFIFAKRGQYKSKENTPDKWKFIWDKDWEKVQESKYSFNTKTTGMSLYDDMFKKPDYFKYYKGKIFDIVQMSPEEFIKKTKNKTSSNPLAGVDMERVSKYASEILKGKKFDMPILDYDEDNWVEHEGRHRVLAMQQLGVNKIDVMIIKSIKPDHEKWFDMNMKNINIKKESMLRYIPFNFDEEEHEDIQ